MKRGCFYIYVLLLVVLTGLPGCVAEVEETLIDPVEVKTQFCLFFPDFQHKNGRMTSENVLVDENPTFTGMQNIRLFPFSITPHVVAGTTAFSSYNILNRTSAPVEGTAGISYWYDDVDVDVYTNTFLMYGVAKETVNDEFAPFRYGKTKDNFSEIVLGRAVNNLRFSPVKIARPQDFAKKTLDWRLQWAKELINRVLQSNVGEQDNQKWCTTKNALLSQLYEQFVTNDAGGRTISASSLSLAAMLEDLYNQLNKVKVQVIKEEDEIAATALANAIQTAITTKWTDAQSHSVQLKAEGPTSTTEDGVTFDAYRLSYATTSPSVDPDFPMSLHLPDGAVTLNIQPGTPVGTPATADYKVYSDQNVLDNPGPWDLYVYPAQLYFTTNTPIAAVPEKVEYQGDQPWNEFLQGLKGVADYVGPLTQMVILKKPIQYAMGNLETRVSLKTTTLAGSGADENINFTGGLKWTGLMVAEQREVGWNFTREEGTLDEHPYVVYDADLNGNASEGAQPGHQYRLVTTETMAKANYTLVYPTAKVALSLTGAPEERVKVILEFENGNDDFHGVGGCLIPAHTRFYIPGLLNLKDVADASRRPQVFESDYITKVEFCIKDLKNAYNSVPDLRAIKTNLGLAVNLSWTDHFHFDDVEVNK